MKEMFPFYTPEWKFTPENPDPGTALFLMFAQMFQDTIKRFNRVPLKNYIAFLNLLDTSVIPARPASAAVVFKLSEGAKEPVFIPAGTQTAAKVPGNANPVIFETETDMLATPAVPVDGYIVSSVQDKILKLPGEFFANPKKGEVPPVVLFDFTQGVNMQEHCLYIGHDNLFNLNGTAQVRLEFINSKKRYTETSICEKLANCEHMEWMYRGEDDWHAFDEVLNRGNMLILKKTKRIPAAAQEIDGVSSRWIRCRAKAGNASGVSGIEVDGILVSSEFYDCENRGGLAPDMVFHNDVQADCSGDVSGFYPFGEFFAVYDTFYLSSSEVFSKKGAAITIKFTLKQIVNKLKEDVPKEINWKMIMKKSEVEQPEPQKMVVLRVSWEYWNGSGWVKLLSQKEYEEIFYDSENTEKCITFKCPKDLRETPANNHMNYWIRARVISIQNLYAINSVYSSPWIENIRLKYEFEAGRLPVEQCLTYNNMEYRNRAGNLDAIGRVFNPFYTFSCKSPAFYLGFEQPPLKGPIGMLFSIQRQDYCGQDATQIKWEYLKEIDGTLEWSDLKVFDGTNSFTGSGIVRFTGSKDFARDEIFERNLYWIRAVNHDGKFDQNKKGTPAPIIKGLYMNSTRVLQQESIRNERFEAAGGKAGMEYSLARFPIIYEEVWVDEVGHIGDDYNLEEYKDKLPIGDDLAKTDVVKDETGKIKEFWIRWENVSDFLRSGQEDRHYAIDRISGKLSFGDGIHGRIPPASGVYNIRVNYKMGGGIKGNVGSFDISELQNSIAFVESVFNPEPSGGGCEMEMVEDAIVRGPQVVKHRNKAVTAEDFEWLTRQASQNIAKVRCLPNRNTAGIKETGSATVVIVTKDEGKDSMFFPELKAQVERYLMERTANSVIFPGKINVIEPVLIEISVHAVLAVNGIGGGLLVEKAAVDRLNDFLHTLKGNYGKGWEIGIYPHISVLYTLLKSVEGVSYVEKVSISINKIEAGKTVEVDADGLADLLHGIITSGKHTVDVDIQ